jgi:hypothetical protein
MKSAPKPVDESWSKILELLEVPTTRGLFVLGSFAKRVTVYSQQLRALNLVDALAGMGYLRKGSQVAVVGAGFAGLTAAAAMTRMGVSVALFDRQRVPLHLQLNCATRYVHPHIYDWPERDIDTDIKANLPILDWHANQASVVARGIIDKWHLIRDAATGMVEEALGKEVVSIQFINDRWRLATRQLPEPAVKDAALETEIARTFDLVILATGFGIEKDDPHSLSYWGDIPLNENVTASHRWMISGAGDGALTDVMRLCLPNRNHADALRKVIAAVKRHGGPTFLETLSSCVRARDFGIAMFAGLDAKKIVDELDPRPGTVLLNATMDGVFGTSENRPRSSVLNRLVTWLMLESGTISLVAGRVSEEKGAVGERGRIQVTLEGGSTPFIECQEFLRRHGPEPVILPKDQNGWSAHWVARLYGRALKRLQLKWKHLYDSNQEDPTLRHEWSASAFHSSRLPCDTNSHSAALLYSAKTVGSESDEQGFVNMVQAVLNKPRIRTQLKELTGITSASKDEVIRLRVEDAVRDPRAFGYALQSLCRIPLLIVDGSEITPALAFLLGIRSVVRRGVTILFRIGSMNVKAWEQLAFNLRELRIISLPSRHSVFAERPLASALEEGLRRYGRRPFDYADLPGFSALRNLGSHEDDTSIKTPDKEVLVLCPFEEEYERRLWPLIQRALIDRYSPDTESGPARRVIDLESPEMLERRLFEAIRRDSECIVDLTQRRPNVFFELGLRLAAHPNGARIIRCEDFGGTNDACVPEQSTLALEELFGARTFHFIGNGRGASAADAMRLDVPVWPGGALSASYTFEVAQRCVCPDQEGGGLRVLDLLWNAVEGVGGEHRHRTATYPILYADNPLIRRQATRFLFEGLLGFLVLADRLCPGREPRKRELAVENLKDLLAELQLDSLERARFEGMIANLESHHES